MPVLRIPTPLRSYTAGQSEIPVQGATVAEAMQDLIGQFPSLQPHLYNGNGALRPFVNLFIGENNIKDLNGLETPLKADDRLLLIPSIAGGCGGGSVGQKVETRSCKQTRPYGLDR